MSATALATAALVASVIHPQINVTAGPYKSVANPGQAVIQTVSNHGTIPETISIGVDEIGHVKGACGFTHPAAPLAKVSASSVYLRPGEAHNVTVTVAKSAPAGLHDLTVDYTVTGSGNVKVAEGVATVIGVTYPGAASSATPCVAISPTTAHHGISPAIPGAATVLMAIVTAIVWIRRKRRKLAARRYQAKHGA